VLIKYAKYVQRKGFQFLLQKLSERIGDLKFEIGV